MQAFSALTLKYSFDFHVISMQNNIRSANHSECLMIYVHTSVFVVVGRDEGPFSAPKALEAPMGELGPEPGALLVGVESRKH